MNKKEALNQILIYREQIEDILAEISAILQVNFPENYSVVYQHWMPQIKTALRDNTKWLPRGQYSMDYTINSILDSITDDSKKGVSKYITKLEK